MDIHGIIFDDEYYGEPVNLGGLDTAPCELVVGPGVEDGTGWKLSTVRGRIIEIRKVFGTSTCQNDADRGLLDLNRGRRVTELTTRARTPISSRILASATPTARSAVRTCRGRVSTCAFVRTRPVPTEPGSPFAIVRS